MIDARSWLTGQARAIRLPLAVTIALGSAIGAVVVWQTSLVVRVVSEYVAAAMPLSDGAVRALVALPFVIIVRALLTLVARRTGEECSSRVKVQVREGLLASLRAIGPTGLRDERPGELATTLVDGVEELDAYFSRYLPQRAIAVALPVLILAVAYPVDPISGGILTVTALFLPLLMIVVGSEAADRNRRWWSELSTLSARLFDVLAGITTLKAFGVARDEVRVIRELSERHRSATMEVLRVAFVSSLMLELVTTVSIAIVAVVSGFRLLHGSITFAHAYFILLIAPEFYLPLRSLGTHYHARMAALSVTERITALDVDAASPPGVDASPKPSRTDDGVATDRAAAGDLAARVAEIRVSEMRPVAIELHSLSVRFPDRTVPALRDVDLAVRAGARVAVIGASGAGKSTLLAVLLGFVAPDDGRILVDGLPLPVEDERSRVDAWRARTGWVPQRPTLFHGTLAWNIGLGDPAIDADSIAAATRRAGLDPLISRLPDGLETIVAEEGRTISGGELQRIALARVYLRDPGLLLLDEPTAHLDARTERQVLSGLDEFASRRTTVIVAHGAAAARLADDVIVLDGGRVVERGTHAELERSGSLYRDLLVHGANG